MTRPPSAHDKPGRDGDGRKGEEAESSEDGNTLETDVEEEGGIFEDLEFEGDGRKIDDFELNEVEQNPADSEEEE